MSVSVILPYYNAASTLERAVDSVLSQTLEDFELILVNDGSSDDSENAANKLARKDSRIKHISIPHGGVVVAMNQGIATARFALLARMDADDWMEKDRLLLQKKFLDENQSVGIVGCKVILEPDESVTDGMRVYIQWQNSLLSHEQITSNIYREMPLANPTIMLRRSILKAGLFCDGDFPEDYEFQLRMYQNGVIFGKIEYEGHHWYDSCGRLTRSDSRYRREAFDCLKIQYLNNEDVLKSRPIAFWGAGQNTRQRFRLLEETGIVPEFYIDVNPSKIGNRIHGIPVYPPEFLHGKNGPGPFVLGLVANHGATEAMENFLLNAGYSPAQDYYMLG